MRHAKSYRKLSRQRSHYRALLRNLALALFHEERIKTTMPKAKELRRFAEKLISLGKRGDLHARRRAMALMGNKVIHKGKEREDVVGKLFSELAERYKNRHGGYTRILRLPGSRVGDGAPLVFMELVDAPEERLKKPKKTDEEDSEEGEEEQASSGA